MTTQHRGLFVDLIEAQGPEFLAEVRAIDVPAQPMVHVYETTTGHGTFYRREVTPEQLALKHGDKPVWLPLYTHPAPQPKRLTDAEIFKLAENYDCGARHEDEQWQFTSPNQMLTFVRAIEAAVLGEKP